MATITLRFYAQLNDFLAYRRRQVTFQHAFEGSPSVKDVIEALGVPHTEVTLILADEAAVDFDYHPQDGDRISVYPAFAEIDLPEAIRLRPEAGALRFVADVHLGRLAAYLRMLGFDTLYPEDYRDEELARIASEEDRILLSRDRGLLKRRIVRRGYAVRNDDPWDQLAEVIQRYNLYAVIDKFRRCASCNGVLEAVDKAEVFDRLPAKTRAHYDEFWRCGDCGKLYWHGSHFEQLDQFVDKLLAER